MTDEFIKVLIIEDNDLFRKSLTNVINKSSKMKCAGSYISAEDALKDIEQKELKPQVVLMDIGLPGITGVECISYIKDLSNETKIIMLTIHDDDDNIFNTDYFLRLVKCLDDGWDIASGLVPQCGMPFIKRDTKFVKPFISDVKLNDKGEIVTFGDDCAILTHFQVIVD